jgi:hypothetical protein
MNDFHSTVSHDDTMPTYYADMNTRIALTQKADEVINGVLCEYQSALRSAHSFLAEFHALSQTSRCYFTEYDTTLREAMAKERSFRRADFDTMMAQAAAAKADAEFEISTRVQEYLAEQTAIGDQIISELRDASRQKRLEELHALLNTFSELQRKRRDEISIILAEFKSQQETLYQNTKKYISESKALRVKDLRDMFLRFKADALKRRQEAEIRRASVQTFLTEIRKE